MRKYYDQLKNPWIDAALTFFNGFGAKRDQVHAIENQQAAQRDQAWGQAIGSGLQTAGSLIGTKMLAGSPNIAKLTPMQRMGVLSSLTPGLKGLSGAAGQIGEQEQRLAGMEAYDKSRTDQNMREQENALSLAETGLPAEQRDRYQQQALIDAAKAGTLAMGPNDPINSPSPLAPPADQGGGMMGPPSPGGEQLPNGLVRDYHPTTLRNIRDIDEAAAKLDADTSLDPVMRSAARQRLAALRAQQVPMVMRKPPGPPTTAEWLQQGNVQPVPNGGGKMVAIDAKGTPHFFDPPSKPPVFQSPATPEADQTYQRTHIAGYDKRVADGWTFITQPDGKIDHVAPPKDDSGPQSFIVADPKTGTSREFFGNVVTLEDGTRVHSNDTKLETPKPLPPPKPELTYKDARAAAIKETMGVDPNSGKPIPGSAKAVSERTAQILEEANAGQSANARLKKIKEQYPNLALAPDDVKAEVKAILAGQ